MDCIKAAYPTSLESLFSMINVAFGTGRPGLCIKHGPKSYVSKEKSREGVIPLPAISKRYLEPLTICNGDVLNSKKTQFLRRYNHFIISYRTQAMYNAIFAQEVHRKCFHLTYQETNYLSYTDCKSTQKND